MDEVAEIIELLANLSDEDRRVVLRHFHDELRQATQDSFLPGGGMNSGTMDTTAPVLPRRFPGGPGVNP